MKINFKSKYLFFIIFLFVALISVGFSMWNIASSNSSVNGEINTEEVDSFSDYIELGTIDCFKYYKLGSSENAAFVDMSSTTPELTNTGNITIPITFNKTGSYSIIIEVSNSSGLSMFNDIGSDISFNASSNNGVVNVERNHTSATITINYTAVKTGDVDTINLTFTLEDFRTDENGYSTSSILSEMYPLLANSSFNLIFRVSSLGGSE